MAAGTAGHGQPERTIRLIQLQRPGLRITPGRWSHGMEQGIDGENGIDLESDPDARPT
jgi:hypothetical protein